LRLIKPRATEEMREDIGEAEERTHMSMVASPACGCCGQIEGYYCSECVKRLTTPLTEEKKPEEPQYITQMRKIVAEKTAAGVRDENGKKFMCDMFTASAATQVWDALSTEQRTKLLSKKLTMRAFINFAWKCVK
jgi:hypothetical protein